MNAKKSIGFISILLAIAGQTWAHEAHHDHPAENIPVRVAGEANINTEAKPLAARFDLKSGKIASEWYLWRGADRIEMADLATGQNNIWERSGQHDYSYQRVFNKDQRVVEYSAGEIRTRHAEPDWNKLLSVVSPQLLQALKRRESRLQFGQNAVHYTGTVNGQQIDLWWLETALLPSQLVISGGQQNLSMTLKELHAESPADWPRATPEKLASYGRIDAADFGDMENDPFVARVLRQDGHDHSH